MEIRKIAPTSLEVVKKKRVAVYARVSSDKDAAENSLNSQLDYFSIKIHTTPNWTPAKRYVDDGISGTKENRPGFQLMMEDARKGEFDAIITKSITRFARNTVVLLDAIRELKSLGIDVIFENDHVSLNSVQGELLISLLAAHAEEQSRSASDNKRWQIKRDFENGRPTFFRIYGYKWADGQLRVIPEEANIVRRIFTEYLNGKGTIRIAKELNADGIASRITKWRAVTIHDILRNEKYTGDLLLQKFHVPDFRKKQKVRNVGQWRQFLVTDAHEAIVDRETFERVQSEIKRRQEAYTQKNAGKEAGLFTGKIVCGNCGRHFVRKLTSAKERHPIWKCSNAVLSGRTVCNAKQIRESILIKKTHEVLGLDPDTELTRELIDERIISIESAAGNRLRFFFTDGKVEEVSWSNPSRRESWTPEMREKARQKAKAMHAKRKEAQK